MLSYAAWQQRYGGKEDVLGQVVTLDGAPHTIIGVLPREFHFAPAEPAEFWTTLNATGGCEKRRSCHNLYGVARLKDGVSLRERTGRCDRRLRNNWKSSIRIPIGIRARPWHRSAT